jgi:sialate O-acetylesterase
MKENYFKIFYVLIFLLLGSELSYSQLRVASIFSDNMVLQQNEVNYIWGWAEKEQKVTLETSWLTNKIVTKVDASGFWKMAFSVPAADLKSHSIEISTHSTVVINNVVFGEIWICSGQSNMQMPLKGNLNQPVIGSNEAILSSKNSLIRQCFVKQNYCASEVKDCDASWEEANPNTVGKFSAVGYFFALKLYQSLQIPVGIINTSWGSTRIEAWMDREILENEFPETNLSEIGTNKMSFQSPTVVYNGMVNPLVGLKIKGVLWYQGESNISGNPKEYNSLFPAMINRWRSLWKQGDFPFYYVQIAPHGYSEEQESYLIREAQLKTLDKISNTGMVTTNDVGEKHMIHPSNKKEVGDRLAYLSLNKTYGYQNIECGGPLFKSIKISGSRAVIEFSNASNGLTTFNKTYSEFLIAGNDSVFYPANVKLKNQRKKPYSERRPLLVVYSEKVPKPIAVRYCWSNWYVGSLFGTGGNPASPFRTDDWNK